MGFGLQTNGAEDGASWLTFMRDVSARDLIGGRLVTSTPIRAISA